VESEIPVVQRRRNQVVLRATEILPKTLEHRFREPFGMEGEKSVPHFQAMFQRRKHLAVNAGADHETVNNRLDPRMVLFAQLQLVAKVLRNSIDPHSPIPLKADLFEHMLPILAEDFE